MIDTYDANDNLTQTSFRDCDGTTGTINYSTQGTDTTYVGNTDVSGSFIFTAGTGNVWQVDGYTGTDHIYRVSSNSSGQLTVTNYGPMIAPPKDESWRKIDLLRQRVEHALLTGQHISLQVSNQTPVAQKQMAEKTYKLALDNPIVSAGIDHGTLRMGFSTDAQMVYRLDLVDILGRVIYSNSKLQATTGGDLVLPLGQAFNPGTYFVRVSSGEEVWTRKVESH